MQFRVLLFHFMACHLVHQFHVHKLWLSVVFISTIFGVFNKPTSVHKIQQISQKWTRSTFNECWSHVRVRNAVYNRVVLVKTMLTVLSSWRCHFQAHREGGVGGKLPQTPQRLGALLSLKYKAHQNAPFKKKIKTFLCRGTRGNVSPGPAVALNGRPGHGESSLGSFNECNMMT